MGWLAGSEPADGLANGKPFDAHAIASPSSPQLADDSLIWSGLCCSIHPSECRSHICLDLYMYSEAGFIAAALTLERVRYSHQRFPDSCEVFPL